VNGSVAGGRAGTWLDVGDVTGDISNKDLIVGSPDVAASRGEVRVLYGWVARTDTFTLDDFHVLMNGLNQVSATALTPDRRTGALPQPATSTATDGATSSGSIKPMDRSPPG
jgi:hypothetical protein